MFLNFEEENKVIRSISGSKRNSLSAQFREFNKEKRLDFYTSSCIVSVGKSVRLQCNGNVSWLGGADIPAEF
jgi:hypothetical protein